MVNPSSDEHGSHQQQRHPQRPVLVAHSMNCEHHHQRQHHRFDQVTVGQILDQGRGDDHHGKRDQEPDGRMARPSRR
jgi:hypothetical protein